MVIKFMGIPAPWLKARLGIDELVALQKELREEEAFQARKEKWAARQETGGSETLGPKEKEFWWWFDEETQGWVGRCSGKKNPVTGMPCVAIVRAVGLVHVEGKRVRSKEGIKVSDEAHYCIECRPRIFGKVSGRASLGVPMWGVGFEASET